MLLSTEKYQRSKGDMHLVLFVSDTLTQALIFEPGKFSVEGFEKVDKVENLSIKNEKFSDVRVVIVNTTFTLIPEAIFEREELDNFLSFAVEKSETTQVYHDLVACEELQVVWGMEQELKAKITNLWPGSTFSHWMSFKLKQLNKKKSSEIHLDAMADYLSVVLFKNGKLELSNLFPIQSDSDALYYSLIGLERSNLLPDQIKAIISSGKVGNDAFKKYFPNISDSSTSWSSNLNLTDQDKVLLNNL